jgi:exodeoxyribonuclease-5
MSLFSQQKEALEKINDWFFTQEKESQFFFLSGYAGTGKTFLIRHFVNEYLPEKSVLYAAFTGKAALQMRKSGCHGAQTLHSLIYTRKETKSGEPMKWVVNDSSPLNNADLLILDECSMINSEMGEDILSFEKPVLYLGDLGQLPPIKGTGFFQTHSPHFQLTEVHRQAVDSPIIELSTEARKTGSLRNFQGVKNKFIRCYKKPESLSYYDQILVGYNKTRNMFNDYMRKKAGFTSQYPEIGDKLICLRNDSKTGLLNGMIGSVTKVELFDFKDSTFFGPVDYLQIDLQTDEQEFKNLKVHKNCFTSKGQKELAQTPYCIRKQYQEFDFGYAITVHKSQGSQWDKVLFIDDGFMKWKKNERKKWLYTGITRAVEQLHIAKKFN